jgi:hypothetical protein
MLAGTPTVTTTIGAEAMHGDLEWNGIVADDPRNIAEAAVKLYSDVELWNRSQRNGIKIINELYQKKEPGDRFILRIFKVQNNLQKHRADNFTGAMLLHHTVSGTKYMSKWIEEKNKIIR